MRIFNYRTSILFKEGGAPYRINLPSLSGSHDFDPKNSALTYCEDGKIINVVWAECDQPEKIIRTHSQKISDKINTRYYAEAIVDGELYITGEGSNFSSIFVASRIILP